MSKPVILLTNDDGINSPGLAAAAEALLPLGRLIIVAPLRQQTSMSRAMTGVPEAKFESVPLTVNGTVVEAYSLDASPAAVVRHFFIAQPDIKPDLVVAGINYGENIGVSVTTSGTVGATIEAAMRGSPALAMSLETDIDSQWSYTEQDWSGGIHFTHFFAEKILLRGLAPGVDILKVEVPTGADVNTPWRMTRLSPSMYYTPSIINPRLLESRRSDIVFSKQDGLNEPPDTDAYAIRWVKEVAVTPLIFDLTARTPLDAVASWMEGN